MLISCYSFYMCNSPLLLNFLHLSKENPTFTGLCFRNSLIFQTCQGVVVNPLHTTTFSPECLSVIASPNWVISAFQVQGEQHVQRSVSLISFMCIQLSHFLLKCSKQQFSGGCTQVCDSLHHEI